MPLCGLDGISKAKRSTVTQNESGYIRLNLDATHHMEQRSTQLKHFNSIQKTERCSRAPKHKTEWHDHAHFNPRTWWYDRAPVWGTGWHDRAPVNLKTNGITTISEG